MFRSEYRPLVWLAVIGIMLYGAVMAYSFAKGDKLDEEERRPPVSREQAVQTALTFLKSHDLLPETIGKTEAVYESDKPASAYLEKNKLTDAFNSKLENQMPLDYWQVFIETGRTASSVNVSMKDAVVTGWNVHSGGAGGAQQDDKLTAEKAVIAAGYSLNDFQYAGPSNRSTTHTFTSLQPVIGDAKMIIKVGVGQGIVTGFQSTLIPPDSFTVWFDRQNKLASTMSFASLGASALLAIAALVLMLVKAKHVHFGRGIVLTLLFAVIYVINTVNSLPGQLTQWIVQFGEAARGIVLILSLIMIGLLAVALYFSVISGEQLWREKGWNAWARWREADYGRHVWTAMGRGYLICLFVLGVQQVLFAAAEQSFHTFAINDPTQSLMNMHWPYVFPTLAWMAGISEEIMFRLFGIIVLRLLVRNTFAAVLLSSILWALGHAAYTIYPSYTRLIEVTVLGLIFGYTFLRYGLITAIFAHATMDSILMALSLMFSGNAEGVLAGIGYIALPAVIAGCIYKLHRSFWRPPQPLKPSGPEYR